MIKLHNTGTYLLDGRELLPDTADAAAALQAKAGWSGTREEAAGGTIAAGIIDGHNSGSHQDLALRFDSLTSHDITYVGIIQTARASGMTRFPMPYVLTNCHNSLCAVGGTINEDDHMFALSAAKKYGGIYVPTNLAVIHSYNREMMSGCGRMILGSDSHTRYGALGTMAVGEGGGELAKQLLGKTYDMPRPQVVGVYLTGKPRPGVGPQDIALTLVGAVFKSGFVKNKVLEFVGDGIAALPVEYRNGIDVMTTETTCWSSIWCTDQAVQDYFVIHGRPEAYKELQPGPVAYYDSMIEMDLSLVEPTIALPFHPSNALPIRQLLENPQDHLRAAEQEAVQLLGKKASINLLSKVRPDGIYVDQGIIAGCSGGTFDSIVAAANIMEGHSTGNGAFTMSVYPGSQPTYLELLKCGAAAKLMAAGVIMRESFCGPCFGAGDTPANGELSIRHATRNFPNREGSKPGEGQLAAVALMDARSIAATAINGGRLTPADELSVHDSVPKYYFDKGIYDKRVFDGTAIPMADQPLLLGPNIRDWPEISALTPHLLLRVASYITDPVTTTDELIPSGETSSFRSNPLRLAEFTLSRKDPDYVPRAKAVQALETDRRSGRRPQSLEAVYSEIQALSGCKDLDPMSIGVGSVLFACKPGDGSAREQAASCQRVLGGWANLAVEYATKRYRSNLINWGMLPLLIDSGEGFGVEDWLFFPNIRQAVEQKADVMEGYVLGVNPRKIAVRLGALTDPERRILLDGCLINYYRG